MELSVVTEAVSAAGLVVRGAFRPEPEDAVPPADGGAPVGTLVLVGNAGNSMWRAFSASAFAEGDDEPLDAWSAEIIGKLGRELGATPLFPFGGPPFLPFIRWAQRAESVWPSPIGPLIHPDYGLWHAYRGALAFAANIPLPARASCENPCISCEHQPCLSTCPVGAFTPGAYDVPACVAHIESAAGTDCMETGCRARRACPVGSDYRYSPAQAAFHMRAFARARRQ